MKILIVSDTHRKDDNLEDVIAKEAPIDMLIHLGDVEGSEYLISELVGENCEVHIVKGNNDFFSSLENEEEVEIGPYRALLTHGHYYNVSLGPEQLAQEAADRGMDFAMYGHTHRPMMEDFNGVTVLNPGSLSYPRQEGRKCTYMIMYLSDEDDIDIKLFEI